MAGPSICPRTGRPRVGRHKWLTHSIVALSTSSLSRPRFFPCPSFPDDNWSSLKIVAKSFPRNRLFFSFFFFLSNLKSRISTLGSLNFASFYKSFISTFLFFFNFKFLILLPFDGGRTELECFEKFKFSFASLFSFEVRLSKLRHLD